MSQPSRLGARRAHQQRVDRYGDRRFDAALARHLDQRHRGLGAVRELAVASLARRFVPADRLPKGEIAPRPGLHGRDALVLRVSLLGMTIELTRNH